MENNNRKSILKSDFHLHSKGSIDGIYSIDQLLTYSMLNNVKNIAITDHNSCDEVQNFLVKNKRNLRRPFHMINGVMLIPGVEITCRMPDIENTKGNSTKLHLLVYAPNLKANSPLIRLLQIKHKNDTLVDFGLLNYIAEIHNIQLSEGIIRHHLISTRAENPGFSTYGRKNTLEFFAQNNIEMPATHKQLENLISNAPRVQRLNLDVADVIKVAHESGAICLMAHPNVNLDRTIFKQQAIKSLVLSGIDGFEIMCNTMDNDTYRLIMDGSREFAGNREMYFIGGSDTHIIDSDNTVGKIAKDTITQASQIKFLEKIEKLENRKLPENASDEVENIINKYAQMSYEYEMVYEASKHALAERQNIKNTSFKFDKEKDLNPEDFKNFDDYIRAVMREESTTEEVDLGLDD